MPIQVRDKRSKIRIGLVSLYDPNASFIIDRMIAAGETPNDARKQLINTTVKGLKGTNYWASSRGIYFEAAHGPISACLNWKSGSFNLTPVNAPTFTVNQGYQSDGATSYLDSNYNPTIEEGFQQDSAHLSIWSRTDVQSGMGDVGTTNSQISSRSATDAFNHRINGAASLNAATCAVLNGTGHFVSSRTLSASCRGYTNGSPLAGEQALVSTAPDNNTIRFCGRGGSIQYSARQQAFGSFGLGLSAADIADAYPIILSYMQGVGAA